MKRFATGAIAATLVSLAAATSSSFAQQAPAPPAAPATARDPQIPPDLLAGTCEDCHGDRVKAFRTNAHGYGKHPKDAPLPDRFCEACHGDGKAHRESNGEATLIFLPQGRAGADRACLPCHEEGSDQAQSRIRVHQESGAHANSDTVHCLTCHSIQHDEPRSPYLLRRHEVELCATCHPTEVASFRNQPYAHRIGRGGMECSSCHDPHGLPGRDNLRMTATGELPCVNCHFEKRGPHVFEHGGAADGDCLTCHEAHGSSNPKMLKRATVAQLCIECHSPLTGSTLGSQPPSFHNLALPRYQNCTTCHVKVHGSDRDPQLLK
jgi:DmsE family decaheme c-type cytochrome